MQFEIGCRAPRGSDCPLDIATRTARFRFTLASSAFCPQVVDSIGLSAALVSYADAARTIPKDDFLDTQIAYFRLAVTSDKASLTATRLWELSVVKTALGSSVALLTHDLMDAGVSTALGSSYDLVSSPGGPAAVGAASISMLQLRIKTDAAHLNLVQDEIAQVTLAATVRVQYANAGQVSILSSSSDGANDDDESTFVSMRGFVGDLAAFGTASSFVSHSLAASSRSSSLPPSSPSSQSSPVAGVGNVAFIGILVAASAFIVLVASVVVVNLSRRAASSSERGESGSSVTELASSSSTTTTNPVAVGATLRDILVAYDVGEAEAGDD
jgi:hypothetical protein